MDTEPIAELDERRITKKSQIFAAQLFDRFPEFRRFAKMERQRPPHTLDDRQHGDEKWGLLITVPAPSGDPQSNLAVWDDGGCDPSVEFGAWHTHEDHWGAVMGAESSRLALLDLIANILTERYVLCESVGGAVSDIIDLSTGRPPGCEMSGDAAFDEMMTEMLGERVRLRSWTGRLDRMVTLDDLDRENSA